MLESPDEYGKKTEYAYHEYLQIEKNVRVRAPSTVTQKLKITVVEDVAGKEKRFSPHIELPLREVNEIDDTSEYHNIQLLLIVEVGGNNFSFPIEGSAGQRGSRKDKAVPLTNDSKIVFFSRARIPNSPIKKELRKIGVNQMSLLFLVNGRVVRDTCERIVIITTDNTLGAQRRTHNQLEWGNSTDFLPMLEIPPFAHTTIDTSKDTTVSETSNYEPTQSLEDVDESFYINNQDNKKRKLDTLKEPVDNLMAKLHQQIDYLTQEEGSEQVQHYIKSFSSQKFTARQLSMIVQLLGRIVEKKNRRIDSWIDLLERLET